MMDIRWFAVVMVVLVLAVGGMPRAAAQEVQVPLDPDSTVYTIDADLEQQLGLFPDVDGFQEAQLFRLSARTYELVILYRQQGETLRRRRTLSASEVADLRQQVGKQFKATGATVGVEQPGRNELLTWTTILGLAEGGLLIGAVAPENPSSALAGIPLLTGAAGFFGPLFATRDRPVTEASGTLTGFGGLQGYAHAVQLVGLLGGDDADGQATAGLAVVTGAAEATAGYVLGARRGWSPGMAEMIAYNGVFGHLVGLGTGITLVGDDNLDEDAGRTRAVAGTSLLGSLAGMYVGHRLGRTESYTRGDARLYGLSGLLATQLAISALVVADADDARAVAGTLTGSGLAGLGVGAALVQGRDFSTYGANLITLGNYAGSLLGAGLATVANGGGDAVTVAQALGAVAGFGITYNIFSDAAQRSASATPRTDLRLHLTPTLHTTASRAGHHGLSGRIRPGFTLRASF